MPRLRHRRHQGYLLALLAVIAVGALIASGWERPTLGKTPSDEITIGHLKIGLGCWESGGRYDIENPRSGAYGKYQIMPANWPSWARLYVGRSKAPQTPTNQERVASGKLRDLKRWLNGWDRVLYWWLTGGRSDRSTWSATAKRYVDGILSMADRAGTPAGRRSIPKACLSTPGDDPSDPRDDNGGNDGDKPPSGKVYTRKVTARSIWIRADVGSQSKAIGYLLHGNIVRVVDHDRDAEGRAWIRIEQNGRAGGWIARWYTQLVK